MFPLGMRECDVMYVPHQWCWRCGRAVPNGFVRRRVVQTGSGHGTSYGTTLHVTDAAYFQPVSLCPRCDDEIAEEEAERERTTEARRRWWWRVGLGTWLAIGLTIAHVPIPVSLLIAWVLTRMGMVGRAVLTLHAVAILAKERGWEPERDPTSVLILWGTTTSALAVWKYRHAISSWLGRRLGLVGTRSMQTPAPRSVPPPVLEAPAKEPGRE
jgi:hypothetical protein